MHLVSLANDVQEQLLGRAVRQVLTPADRQALSGERILITGAGGTVGSELSRQLAACGPARLTLLDQSEYALFRIEEELRGTYPDAEIDIVLGDVTRRTDVAAAMQVARPDVVYHAAAAKHVTMCERSILPAIRTNVVGTFETARAARDAGARFVLISSDKAAEPRSVMGATKRLAELVALGLASDRFRPVAVRFGNILGSSGSLVEIMARCVQHGRNIPITHPDATRFFMTAAEAVSLVLKADLLGGRAEVFWLDMGDPIRIGDLAERFIACATPAGHAAVGIDVIGLRPGEKMREELTTHGLRMKRTGHPGIWSARQRPVRPERVAAALRTIRSAVAQGQAARALGAVEQAVHDFTPSVSARAAALATRPPVARRAASSRAEAAGIVASA